jgi:hypothetical protein
MTATKNSPAIGGLAFRACIAPLLTVRDPAGDGALGPLSPQPTVDIHVLRRRLAYRRVP